MIKDLDAFLEEYIKVHDAYTTLGKQYSEVTKKLRTLEKEYYLSFPDKDSLDLIKKAAAYITEKKERT